MCDKTNSISRRKLDVNFARGGVHDRCEVWKRIRKIVKKHKPARKTQRTCLEEWEKANLLQDIRDGDPDLDWSKAVNLRLLRTTSGRSMSLADMRKCSMHWTFAERGSRAADKIMQSETAICLENSIIDDLSYTGEEKDFFTWLVRRQNYSVQRAFKKASNWYTPFHEASIGITNSYKILPREKWNEVEKRVIRVLKKFDYVLKGRSISIGTSDTAAAWTDGSSYIALERGWLKRLDLGDATGCTTLLAVLTHELAHDERTDSETHIHGEAFYRTFHDLIVDGGWYSPMRLCAYFHSEMRRMKITEHHEKEKAKEIKQKERVQKRLGVGNGQKIAAKAKKPAKVVKKVAKVRVAKAVKTRKKFCGRIPAGALGEE